MALSAVMGKWKVLIVWRLHVNKIMRFGEIRREVGELARVSDKMLTQSLRELEKDGLVGRKVHPSVPPKVEYRLTKEGIRLLPVLRALEKFGSTYETGESGDGQA